MKLDPAYRQGPSHCEVGSIKGSCRVVGMVWVSVGWLLVQESSCV